MFNCTYKRFFHSKEIGILGFLTSNEIDVYRLINFWNNSDANWKYVITKIEPHVGVIPEGTTLQEFGIEYLPLQKPNEK